MPKINAATVAEHRAHQRAALLQAALEILTEQGLAAVTPAAVGARAGLARSSVYQYFPSTGALVASLVEDCFPRANQTIAAAMATQLSPLDRVDAYVRTTLRLAAEGAHRPATALATADLPAPCRERLKQLHAEQARPLVEALAEHGVTNPELTAALIGGMVRTAMVLIEQGGRASTITNRTIELVHQGIESPENYS